MECALSVNKIFHNIQYMYKLREIKNESRFMQSVAFIHKVESFEGRHRFICDKLIEIIHYV